MYHLQYADPPR